MTNEYLKPHAEVIVPLGGGRRAIALVHTEVNAVREVTAFSLPNEAFLGYGYVGKSWVPLGEWHEETARAVGRALGRITKTGFMRRPK